MKTEKNPCLSVFIRFALQIHYANRRNQALRHGQLGPQMLNHRPDAMKKNFPISLDIENAACVVVGGGRVAARKARALAEAGARVRVISPEVCEAMAAIAGVVIEKRPYRRGDLAGAFLVIAATDDDGVQEGVWQEARERGILVNVADVPSRCNFFLPATMRAGGLDISVSTRGRSPALARMIRKRLEREYGRGWPEAAAVMGELRPYVLGLGLGHEKNRVIFNRILAEDFIRWIRTREWDKIKSHIETALGSTLPAGLEERLAAIVRGRAENRGGRP